jgi:hypothetical protein
MSSEFYFLSIFVFRFAAHPFRPRQLQGKVHLTSEFLLGATIVSIRLGRQEPGDDTAPVNYSAVYSTGASDLYLHFTSY